MCLSQTTIIGSTDYQICNPSANLTDKNIIAVPLNTSESKFPSTYLLSYLSFFSLIQFIYFIWLHWVLVTACGIQFPDQGSNPGPLHWQHRILTMDYPRNPSYLGFSHIISLKFWSCKNSILTTESSSGVIIILTTKVIDQKWKLILGLSSR